MVLVLRGGLQDVGRIGETTAQRNAGSGVVA